MNWNMILTVFIYLLEKVAKDTDGDGRLDWFDSEPENPEVK